MRNHPRADHSQVRDEHGTVVATQPLDGGMVELIISLPHLAATAQPGQFAQLRPATATRPLLRRPFSVAWTEEDRCHFVFAPVGEGTRALAGLHPGDAVDGLGPLGVGFSLDGAPRALCVSGGRGCAPFPLLARALRRRGADVVVINGASRAAQLYPPQRFQRGDAAIEVIETTEDGSRGLRGLVTDVLRDRVAADSAIYACGPNPMLAAVAQLVAASPTAPSRAQGSLEAAMGCGFGTCLGCVLPVHGDTATEWALCCSDGPVLDLARVAWDELVAPEPPQLLATPR